MGTQSVNAFAKECGLLEGSIRQYLAGGIPGTDKLAKIAAANHVSMDWLAAGRGPREYPGELQAHHEDFILADYQGDAAAAQRSSDRMHVLMEPTREAGDTLTRIAAELQMEIPMRWFSVLLVQLAGRHISPAAARDILEALKAELTGGKVRE